MGTEDFKMFTQRKSVMRSCADMLIVAGPEHIAQVEKVQDEEHLPGLVTFSCGLSDRIPDQLLKKARLLVVEVDPANPASLERLKGLGQRYPELPRIAALSNATVSLVRTLIREGVSDVVALPFKLDEMLEVALGALDAKQERNTASIRLGPQIAVVRSVGGCGASSIATHLAGALAAGTDPARPVAIVDLDMQSGIVADYLGASGTGTIADLLAAGHRLDDDLAKSVARTAAGNIAVYAAPPAIEPIESVDTDNVLRVLRFIRGHHAAVVLDLPADWTNWGLSVVSASDLIVMVVELSVNSLRQAKRRLDLFASVGIESERIMLVVNRVERHLFKTIDLGDVAQTLSHEVTGGTALEGRELASAQAQGVLVDQIMRKSKFAADIRSVATIVADRLRIGEQ
jgi:pilus assembly protein CpaE